MSSLLAEGIVVYGTIFGFELVDRTHFAVIGLAGRYDHRRVWLGAAGAFVASSAISVAIGFALVATLPAYLPYVKIVGGAILVVFGLRGLLRPEEPGVPDRTAGSDGPAPSRIVLTAFVTILFLEMGDNTQVLTILFVGELRDALLVFVAACLALVSVAALGATSGNVLRSRVSPGALARVLATILIVVGAVTIALGALPLLGVALPGGV